ncbi:flagellin [Octadecabacter antarcticus 307]|uniref:Flagellin n=1 Tax=Octadecabacter antarcticus 307 TaxID=391626 RepID=M9R9P6_9RHOB|nr:flagellin [Octadecabacter antarcticus]AGI68518.1 flagellin [Octadecabacter antarcticus 307]
MSLSIATNTAALMAAASATSVNKDMETSMERLSTGKRINSASDDAAGVAIASRLSSEIRGTNQAIRNAQDGQALIDTAEGAHKEVENILQRMRELAVQSSNDTNDSSDRTNLQAEFKALSTEIDRIAGATTWAGQDLLSGIGGTDADGAFNLQVGANTGDVDTITVKIGAMTTSALGASTVVAAGTGVDPDAVAAATATTGGGVVSTNELTMSKASGTEVDSDFSVTINGTTVVTSLVAASATDAGHAAAVKSAIDAAGIDNLTVVDDGSGKLTFTTTDATDDFDISTRDLATAAIDLMDAAIATVNTQRAELGSTSNRLDNTVSNLTSISIQLEGGRGRIEDADFAAESTSLAKSQILQQASTAMLAQANASKQNVLSLLQG